MKNSVLQELQDFLTCFKKERQGKVIQVKEAILSSTSGKAKVMLDVSTSSPFVTPHDVTDMLNDHTKHLMNHLYYMLENGFVNFFKTLNPSSDPCSVSGIPQAPSSSAQHETLENPLYSMPKNFTMSTLPSRPETAMVISPPIVEPFHSIPSLATTRRTIELANFVPPYQMVTYSTPPIPPRDTGVPRGSVPDCYFKKYGMPDRVPRTDPRGSSVNSFEECLAVVREDIKKQIRETFGVELSNKSRAYQKCILHILIWFPIPWVGAPPILLSSMGRTIGLHGSTLVNI
jgi:hypothetical protein